MFTLLSLLREEEDFYKQLLGNKTFMVLESRVKMKEKALARCMSQYRPLSVFSNLDFADWDIGLHRDMVNK